MKSLSSYGTGPKIGLVTLPYLIGSVVLTLLHPSVFTFGVFAKQVTLWAGVLLLTAGLICYFHTSRQLRAGIRSRQLVPRECRGGAANTAHAPRSFFRGSAELSSLFQLCYSSFCRLNGCCAYHRSGYVHRDDFSIEEDHIRLSCSCHACQEKE